PIERNKSIGPAVARSQNVPGTQDGGIQTSLPDQFLTLGAHRNVFLHQRRRLGHAKVDEMAHASRGGSFDGRLTGDQVNAAKLRALPRTGMRHPYQLNEGVGGSNFLIVAALVQGIPDHGYAAGGKLAFGAGTRERPHAMAPIEKLGNELPAHVAGAARNEYSSFLLGHTLITQAAVRRIYCLA